MKSFLNTDSNINIDTKKFDVLRQQGYKIIDVRSLQEYNESHIENASLIDIYYADFKDKIGRLDRSDKYLVYCRSGNRSFHAVNYMKSAGIGVAFNLSGGIIQWIKSGFPVVPTVSELKNK